MRSLTSTGARDDSPTTILAVSQRTLLLLSFPATRRPAFPGRIGRGVRPDLNERVQHVAARHRRSCAQLKRGGIARWRRLVAELECRVVVDRFDRRVPAEDTGATQQFDEMGGRLFE